MSRSMSGMLSDNRISSKLVHMLHGTTLYFSHKIPLLICFSQKFLTRAFLLKGISFKCWASGKMANTVTIQGIKTVRWLNGARTPFPTALSSQEHCFSPWLRLFKKVEKWKADSNLFCGQRYPAFKHTGPGHNLSPYLVLPLAFSQIFQPSIQVPHRI